MILSRLLAAAGLTAINGDAEITSLTIDSRRVVPGALFVAIPGLSDDGHDFIGQAVSGGAAAVLCERADAAPDGVPSAVCEDSRAALARVAAEFFGHPEKKLRVVGVTGTNGKTSVTYFLSAIWKEAGRQTGVIGTAGASAGDSAIPVAYATSTTPDTIELFEIFAEMVKRGVTDVFMEVTSHALALRKTVGIDFAVGIFTNLTQDHLDFHGSFENYLAAKTELFRSSAVSVANADDPAFGRISASARGRVYGYSIDAPSDFRALDAEYSAAGSTFGLSVLGDIYAFRLAIPGRFAVYNALAAVAAAIVSGLSVRTAAEGAAELSGVPGRIQPIPNRLGFGVFVDYAHTPDGLENIIKAARGFTAGRVITLFGCGGDRDRAKRPIMGRIAGELSDFAVLTSDNPRSEDPDAIIDEALAGLAKTGRGYLREPDRRAAIMAAIAMARPGDSVVIAGKGHENYQEFENKRRIHFDDAEEAAAAIKALGGGLDDTDVFI
ncbi:MAG: UDP-N-acetylmuramoyl-L-alanyl-D-glutamate--2,6-diaminopimelate ligase [Clostridiales bacterium]|jgi:UDP-N-acetylmuramoyl-L-alanyl-D-glutamate--2,6-diaminopimelate ligase|nr:UDP-N-acetylmuramoyl-L-alanyl-D-glutamate--2,6-diaminopimelate ligase [Clostridiales bacterium]